MMLSSLSSMTDVGPKLYRFTYHLVLYITPRSWRMRRMSAIRGLLLYPQACLALRFQCFKVP